MAVLKGANGVCGDPLTGYHARANAVRLQVISEPASYWPDTLGSVARIEEVLRTTSLTVVLDLCHKPPNGMDGKRWAKFSYNELIGNWITVGNRFNRNPRVILQSANEIGLSYADADAFNKRFVTELRRAGIRNTLMIGPPYANPFNLDTMTYWGDSDTWIDVHMYDPFAFTHAGVYGRAPGQRYAGAHRDAHEKSLAFVQRYKSRNLFLGEFAASIYNDLAEREMYYARTIQFANQHCLGWTYHCLGGEGNVWNPAGVRAIQRELG